MASTMHHISLLTGATFLLSSKLPFPFKLHEMLEDAMRTDNQDIVSWQPHGKAFRVHKPREFAIRIMPRHFKQTQYKSFQRQLHIYGFHRITTGKGKRDNGAYYHEMFIQGEKPLSLRMGRQKIKGPDAYETHGHPDPDFYAQQQESTRQTLKLAQSPTTTGIATSSRRLRTILGSETGIIDRVVSNESSSAIQIGCSTLEWVQQAKNILARPRPTMVKSSAVITSSLSEGATAAIMEEAEEMFFAGKRFFFVEPLEDPKWQPAGWRRSSLTAIGTF
jgi:hypothetical protein